MAGDPDIVSDFIVAPTNGRCKLLHIHWHDNLQDIEGNLGRVYSSQCPECLIYRPSIPIQHYEPHIHPRSAEILFLVDGTLEVGFVDTKNNLFTQTLQAGDLFVFPKGSALPAQC
ncbi:unnamed protein product [Prunus armeniaca]|uniref:Germin-like protein n=1 Tax=Prunus armeniaca TaxID=36596 RepID=A0A6J5V5Y4_PRUAR|nr:unnamed protein product [Prunus armeniaca]